MKVITEETAMNITAQLLKEQKEERAREIADGQAMTNELRSVQFRGAQIRIADIDFIETDEFQNIVVTTKSGEQLVVLGTMTLIFQSDYILVG